MMADTRNNIIKDYNNHRSSFRDPSGFLFWDKGQLLRQVNLEYQANFDYLMSSGLYKELVSRNLLIEHEDLHAHKGITQERYRVIKPRLIDFISYPYEWCFSQLKDAALLTLKIQKTCLNYGMTLKDASAYNVQFNKGVPVFIDSLSFEIYRMGSPWIAYRQFCQHFLAPLALMAYTDIHLNKLLSSYIDGIPLDLTVKLLPKKCLLKLSLLMHLYLHAKAQKKYEDASFNKPLQKAKVSLSYLNGIINDLDNTVRKLKLKKQDTEWCHYYSKTNYSDASFSIKEKLVEKYIDVIKPKYIWDFGANIGHFSRIASRKEAMTISFDIDPLAVEYNYLKVKKDNETNILPILIDLTNPSPSIGWNNEERLSLKERNCPDTVMALALIHHLAISNNIPLNEVAAFFSEISNNLIIEFVPKDDSQVQRMLKSRQDIFHDYDQKKFEMYFNNYFKIIDKKEVINSKRIIYLMEKG